MTEPMPSAIAVATARSRPAVHRLPRWMNWLVCLLLLAVTPVFALSLPPAVDDLQRRTFDFFWETADAETGLIPDRYPTRDFYSIAAVGYGLTAYVVGVERQYVSRDDAARRTLTTLRFLHDAPQGPEGSGTVGYKGFYYRYLDMTTRRRWRNIELSSADTALLLGGVLTAQMYFDRDTAVEREIRDLARRIASRVDWRWMQPRGQGIAHGWMPDVHDVAADLLVKPGSAPTGRPEPGFLALDWQGYCEIMLVYVLAIGAPEHAVAPEAWQVWTSGYNRQWGTLRGYEHLTFTAMFGHQFSHVWLDLRGIQDAFMRQKGIDYFENSRRAAYAQRAYAIANPMGWRDYGPNVWGWTAVDGPADVERPYQGEKRRFRTYFPRGEGIVYSDDDGTIAPTAAAASIAFAPEIVVPAVEEMTRRYGSYLIGRYGFFDAFNPSFDYTDVPLRHGRLVPGHGWVDTDWIGIDQGPIVAMIENARSDLVWRLLRQHPQIRRGLSRAGFTGGWLDAPGPAGAR